MNKKRKILVRVLPSNGYNIEAELDEETPIEDIIKTLRELGFTFNKETPFFKGNYEEKIKEMNLIQDIYKEYFLITKEFNEHIIKNNQLVNRWIDIGFNIVDLKNIVESTYKHADNKSTLKPTGFFKLEEEKSSKTDFIQIKEWKEKIDKGYDKVEKRSAPMRLGLKKIEEILRADQKPSLENEKLTTTRPSEINHEKSDLRLTTPEKKLDSRNITPTENILKPEIRPLFGEITPDSCEYCEIFKDIGTMVCPHCGRPLNLRLNH